MPYDIANAAKELVAKLSKAPSGIHEKIALDALLVASMRDEPMPAKPAPRGWADDWHPV